MSQIYNNNNNNQLLFKKNITKTSKKTEFEYELRYFITRDKF